MMPKNNDLTIMVLALEYKYRNLFKIKSGNNKYYQLSISWEKILDILRKPLTVGFWPKYSLTLFSIPYSLVEMLVKMAK
jgi:hypothetical protein